MKYGTDYSKSAENLTNTNEVKNLIDAWDRAGKVAQAASEAYSEAVGKLPESIAHDKATADVAEAHKAVKEAVEKCGGYQDIQAGLYALMQARNSVSYDTEQVEKVIPDYTGIIERWVPPDKIKGLFKGGLITEEQLQACEITKKISSAFIIGVAQAPAREANDAD